MRPKGFTLIELLVVIAIIGLLSSVIAASVNVARVKARDASRRSALTQLKIALETYYVDNGSYPLGPSSGVYYESNCTGLSVQNWYSAGYTGSGGYIPNLAPQYIPVLPSDPQVSGSVARCYAYGSNGTNYTLWDHAGDEEWTSVSSGLNDNLVRIVNGGTTPCTQTENTFTEYGGVGGARCN